MDNSSKLFFFGKSTLAAILSAFSSKINSLVGFDGAKIGGVFEIRKSGFFLLTPSP